MPIIYPDLRLDYKVATHPLREALSVIGGRLAARTDGPITTLAISTDSRWVVTGSEDKTARLWDLRAQDPAANPVVLRGHDDRVYAVAISPDSRWVVTGSSDKTARLWLLQLNDLMNLARITVGRNFSADEWRLYFPSEKSRKTFDELPGPDESVTQKSN
jgi:WD40 repeat protein